MAKVTLGQTVKDRITGLTGIAMGRTEYLTGCAHVGILQKQLTKDLKQADWEWIDETRLEVQGKGEILKLDEPVKRDSYSGPSPNAPEF
jgi:hypothetical protein